LVSGGVRIFYSQPGFPVSRNRIALLASADSYGYLIILLSNDYLDRVNVQTCAVRSAREIRIDGQGVEILSPPRLPHASEHKAEMQVAI
jgi:hypothetical protein